MQFVINLIRANSKAVAAVIGVLLGVLVTQGVIPPEWNSLETQTGVVTAITGLLVWLSPANKPPAR